jgi:hypothetical protein
MACRDPIVAIGEVNTVVADTDPLLGQLAVPGVITHFAFKD